MLLAVKTEPLIVASSVRDLHGVADSAINIWISLTDFLGLPLSIMPGPLR